MFCLMKQGVCSRPLLEWIDSGTEPQTQEVLILIQMENKIGHGNAMSISQTLPDV